MCVVVCTYTCNQYLVADFLPPIVGRIIRVVLYPIRDCLLVEEHLFLCDGAEQRHGHHATGKDESYLLLDRLVVLISGVIS